MRDLIRNRPVFAWALYDWANSAFATTVMAGFFPVFFQKFWSTGVDPTSPRRASAMRMPPPASRSRCWRPCSARLPIAAGAASVSCSPGLCSASAPRGRCTSSARASGARAALLFVLASMGFNGGIVFNDSLMLDVAKPGELDRVSAFGYSLGYLGGGLLFLINVIMYAKPAWFGLRDGDSRGAGVVPHGGRVVVSVHAAADAQRARALRGTAPVAGGSRAQGIPRARSRRSRTSGNTAPCGFSCWRTGSTSTA